MRIAFIGTRGVPARYGGFETCAEQVGRRMVERGHDVTVFCRSLHYPDRPREVHGIRLEHLPALPGKHAETLSHTMLSALPAARHDAIICMGVGNAPVVRALQLFGRRTVFNVDGADWQRAKWSGAASSYLRASEVLASYSSSILVADSEAVQAYYQSRFGRHSEFVPYGADPPADTGTDALREFSLDPGSYTLFVGRLEPENGPDDYLAGVAESGLQVPAVVVGDATYPGDYVHRLRADAPTNAVFTGYQFGRAYQQLTAHAGVFVLAATVGGTHPVLVEQMAAGNCILARSTDSNREVLGEAGLWWETPKELAALLRQAWDDAALRSRLGEAARRRQLERYDWEVVTSSYLDLCARVAR